MKIITGKGQLSLPNTPAKNLKPGLLPIDHFSDEYLRQLARSINTKIGVNILKTSPGLESESIHFAYFPKGGDPNPETRLRDVNRLTQAGEVVLAISDYGPDHSISGTHTYHTPPFKRSANQGYVDEFKTFGPKAPAYILFFTWEISPNQEQMVALGALSTTPIKEIKKSIESATIINSVRK